MNSPPRLRVVLWGTYDTGIPRVRILREGLRAQGAEVIECHQELWTGIKDKSQIKGVSRWLRLLVNAAIAYPTLLWRYMRLPPHDVVLVSYPGLIDLFVLRPFAWWRRTPVAWDWFLSAYDTIVLDRKLLPVAHPASRLIKSIEWLATRLADFIFMDTATHARRMERIFGLSVGRIDHVWVGVEKTHFQATGSALDTNTPAVLFYGQFIPLHGIDTIIQAAILLRGEEINWLVVGQGQEASRIDALIAQANLPRLTRLPWIDYPHLQHALHSATVALGIFGSSDKAASVIPNKVFQILAAGCPLITRDSEAIRELVTPSLQVQLVEQGNAQQLADAVLRVVRADHPIRAPQVAIDRFDEVAIGAQLGQVLASRLQKWHAHD